MINRKEAEAIGVSVVIEDDDTTKTNVNNVYEFTGKMRGRPPQSLAELAKALHDAKMARIEDATEGMILDLFEFWCREHGFDFSDREDANKELAFLIEAMKSVLCKHDGIEHPFHMVADKYFVERDDGELFFLEELPIVAIRSEDDDTDTETDLEGSGC